MEHTPAPWRAEGREIVGPQDSGVIVARLPDWGILAETPDPAPHNARLIAAAPELLAALQWLLNEPSAERGTFTAITYAEEIIAKATGRTIGATK